MKVSVIIPIYNAAQYLAECLDSALMQSLEDIEILCVDDGSTDESSEILARYAAKDCRIKVITQHNSGQSAAQNKAIDVAAGDYVFFLDADDYITDKTSLETLYVAALRTGCKVVGGLVHIFAEEKKT